MPMREIGFWWRMIRPHTLSASIVPVMVGTFFAFADLGIFRFGPFVAMLLASLLIQIATNLFNEYFDYIHGVDTPESIGNSGTIVRDGASPQFVMAMALLCYGLALLLGLYLIAQTSWWLALIGALSMVMGFLYGGGPYPISRTPFGELFSGGIMGTGIILISYYIQSLQVTLEAAIISIPIMILIGLILTANSLRDRVNDIPTGRKTLAILLGHDRTVVFMIFFFALAYLWLLIPIFIYAHHPIILLPLLSIPKAISAIEGFRDSSQTPAQMMPAMARTSQTNQFYGNLYAFAFILEGLMKL